MNVQHYPELKWSFYVLNIKEKIIFHIIPTRVLTNPFAGKCILIFYIMLGDDTAQPKMLK